MTSIVSGAAEAVPRWPLATMRLYAGVVFLAASVTQRPAGHGGEVITGLEAFVGIALTLGVATRGVAVLGIGILVDHLVPIKSLGTFISPGPIAALIALLLTLFFGRAGRVWGVDARLARSHAGIPLW